LIDISGEINNVNKGNIIMHIADQMKEKDYFFFWTVVDSWTSEEKTKVFGGCKSCQSHAQFLIQSHHWIVEGG
jgi:hypothetical protein